MNILESSEFLEMNPTPVEREACLLRWQRIEGRSEDIPPADAVRLLQEIRDRTKVIESSAVEMGRRAMREGRRTPRRHQQVAVAMIAVLIVVLAIGLALWDLIT